MTVLLTLGWLCYAFTISSEPFFAHSPLVTVGSEDVIVKRHEHLKGLPLRSSLHHPGPALQFGVIAMTTVRKKKGGQRHERPV